MPLGREWSRSWRRARLRWCPLYVSYLAGFTLAETDEPSRRRARLSTVATSWLLRRHGRWLAYAHQAAGALLIVFGVALFTGVLPLLSSYLAPGA